MSETIVEGKYVELVYKVVDQNTGKVLTQIDSPLGYVHGVNELLAPMVTMQLEGRSSGDLVEVPVDCNPLYGPRDESLVITANIQDVPPEYREEGTAVLMEDGQGQTRNFLVTRVDARSVTIDGNNPLCGKQVIFKVKIHSVRDATEEEKSFGGRAPG